MVTNRDHFFAAVQFLTVVPVPHRGSGESALRDVMAWFPLVGALVGAVGFVVLWVGAAALPPAVAAGLALAAMIRMTGALHEDGLSDMADGVGAHVTREKALEIMRDSRIGTFGAIALIVAIGLRWAALTALADGATLLALATALAGAAAIGRAGILIVARALPPARPDGLGAALGDGPATRTLAVGLATAVLIACSAGSAGIWALGAALFAVAVVIRLAHRRLGGHTGDVFGAVAVVGETAALIGFSATLG